MMYGSIFISRNFHLIRYGYPCMTLKQMDGKQLCIGTGGRKYHVQKWDLGEFLKLKSPTFQV